ncbi:hypothetical protein F2Y18_15760 [Bacillus cereus]|uniref:DNA primase family protein n=1 Tax=Bacillus cereus TaxID=1396 RepID=UPI00122F96D3|nr:phage/plasmid primase, P4 family [Bacillus cereus]KAA2396100.1 hypothetical protein F2Y18_15760 [Bacillus cereus]
MTVHSNYINEYIKPDIQDSLEHFIYEVSFFKGASVNIATFTDSQLKAFIQILKAMPISLEKYEEYLYQKLDEVQIAQVNQYKQYAEKKLFSYEQLAALEFDVAESAIVFIDPWRHLQQVQRNYRWIKRGLSTAETGKLQLEANTFARYVLERLELVQTEDAEIYRYNGKGVYKPLKDNILKSLCRKILNEAGNSLWKRNFENEYIAALKNEIPYVNEFDNAANIINFPNGLFDIEIMKLKPHTSSYYSINQLDYHYYQVASCPRFEQFLVEVFEDDMERIQLLQEILGYLWIKEIKIQKAFIFLGKGSNGKSVLSKTIRKLVGSQNVSSTSLKNLQDRFGMQDFPGKLVNISGENEFSGDFTTENFKLVTSGDSLTVEKKHKDAFTTTLFVKLIILLNKMMDCRDTSDAFLRRLTIIPFNRKYVELKQGEEPKVEVAYMDLNLEKDLEAELPGIFNFAMEGLKRLKENDFKMTSSSACNEAVEEYRKNQNPVISYIEDRIQFTDGAKVLRSSIYDDFTSWCKKNSINGSRISGRQYMLDELKHQAAVKGFTIREPKIKGNHFFEGIEFGNGTTSNDPTIVVPSIR